MERILDFRSGCRKQDLDTPRLLVDLDAMERNIGRIAAVCRENGKAWRPHIKGLKVPAIAELAIRAGASGITCAKLGEAEVMAAAGIRDILIANQVVGAAKLRRLAELCRNATIVVAVDNAAQAHLLNRALVEADARIGVLIEVDIGIRRAGVLPGEPVVELASRLADLSRIDVRGVMGWEGHACAISDPAVKEEAVAVAVGDLVRSAEMCRMASFPVRVVSCGGTGTYVITARQPGVTELQAGGGIFNDIRYVREFGVGHECALSVLTTVTSRPDARRIVCDAGKKVMSDSAPRPEPIGYPEASVRLSAEHATIELTEPDLTTAVGDKIEFVVGYADVTVNLHDVLVGCRGELAEVAWPILARGRSD